MAELSPEQLIGYAPTEVAAVAEVVHARVPPSEAAVSPFTKPANVAVNRGFGKAYRRVALVAVTINESGVTVSVPGTKVIA